MSASKTAEPRPTPLLALHQAWGGRMGEFAGHALPLRYGDGIIAEHQAVRQAAGLFDVSHMGQVRCDGPDAARLLSRLCPLDAAALAPGASRYTLLLDERAGIIDDLIVLRLAAERYLAVVNAANAEIDLARFEAEREGLRVEIDRRDWALLALQGPAARETLARRIPAVAGLPFTRALETPEGWLVSATGYTGEDGFEIALPGPAAAILAEALVAADGVTPAGLGARDSLRLEAGLCLHGQDLSTDINPYEARLGWAIPRRVLAAGGFHGDAALREAAAGKPARLRVGLLPAGRAPVRAGAPLHAGDGGPVGTVTSGGFSPTLSKPVAMGYIAADRAAGDSRIAAEMRGRRVAVDLASLPFVPHRYWRAQDR